MSSAKKLPYVITADEFNFLIPGHAEPYAVIRRLRLQGRQVFRAVAWAPSSEGRDLIGYVEDFDRLTELLWRRYCDESTAQHELASRTHGGRERGGPAARS